MLSRVVCAALRDGRPDFVVVHYRTVSEGYGPAADGLGRLARAREWLAGVPLFGITNFSHEFWPPFRAQEAHVFNRFRDIVVSGDEKLAKPDAAIFHLARARFGLEPGEGVFLDDRLDNAQAAHANGFVGHHFSDAVAARKHLVDLGLL